MRTRTVRSLKYFTLPFLLTLAALSSCTGPDAPKTRAPDNLVDLQKGIYHAVKEFYGTNSYSLYPRTYEGANQGVDMAKFGFRFLGDSLYFYAIPYSDVACLQKVSAVGIDSITDSSFVLKPTKTTGFFLHLESLPGHGSGGYKITLVGRARGEAYTVMTYPYVPTRVPGDSVCLNDTLEFVWDSGD